MPLHHLIESEVRIGDDKLTLIFCKCNREPSFDDFDSEYDSEYDSEGNFSTVEVETKQRFDEDLPWKEPIVGAAVLNRGTSSERRIGTICVDRIDRQVIRERWNGEMDGLSSELQEFSNVFDHRGFLRRELYEHPFKKGNGVFGPETGLGPFVYIETINVDPEYRRRGVARALVDRLHRVANDPVGAVRYIAA